MLLTFISKIRISPELSTFLFFSRNIVKVNIQGDSKVNVSQLHSKSSSTFDSKRIDLRSSSFRKCVPYIIAFYASHTYISIFPTNFNIQQNALLCDICFAFRYKMKIKDTLSKIIVKIFWNLFLNDHKIANFWFPLKKL